MTANDSRFRLTTDHAHRWLIIDGDLPTGFHGTQHGDHWQCPTDAQNAAALRAHLAWMTPAPVGLRKSVGCGDRLGLATVGHLDAVRGGDMFPVLAQQSIREMQRSQRTPQQVMDDATWGVFQSGYRDGWGCDADHLKNTEAIDSCIAAGYIGFTLDPGDHVDNEAHDADITTLYGKYAALPWDALMIAPADLKQLYIGETPYGEFHELTVMRAACKYSRAILHAATLAKHIDSRMTGRSYDLEVSVDETETPTSPAEHFFIANELIRLGVFFTGLAPRFVGRFEKGVDYIGDLATFEQDFVAHVNVMREFGSYKLSIHSGSDKFSLYPIIARHANPLVHLKTAGTSWLEALRVIAIYAPALFRDILASAISRYPQDRASYHVSAEVENVPSKLTEAQLPTLLDQFDARQILHVTFGSLLAAYREPIYAALRTYEQAYREALQRHFERHIQPFREG
jgi:hypothetical protein